MAQQKVDVSKLIAPAFYKAFLCTKRFVAMKGSRGSGKSKFCAIKMIYNIMKYPLSHGLCVRRYFNTLKASCFADLVWATRYLGVSELWKFSKGELLATYIPTGQTILFRGADKPESMASISVPFGFICWVWMEEASQFENADMFDMVNESIRGGADGKLPDGYYKQFMISFNPWVAKSWLKSTFFDHPDNQTYAFTTTYHDNPWLLPDDIANFKKIEIENPRRARVVCFGDWGVSSGLIYENWKIEDFTPDQLRNMVDDKYNYYYVDKFGLDFGFANDPTAFIAILISPRLRKMYIYDEIEKQHLKNLDIIKEITRKGYRDFIITADSAEVKSIQTMKDGIWDNNRRWDLPFVRPSKKGAGSILAGIAKLQDYQIIVRPSCVHTIEELSTYAWEKDKVGETVPKPIDKYNHLMDAMRYAVEDVGETTFGFYDAKDDGFGWA